MRVLFWKGPSTWFGRLIRLRTGSAYTHCELLFSDGCRFAIEAHIPARFYLNWPGERVTDSRPWDPALWDCIAVPVADEQAVRRFCVGEVGVGYDWLGIFMSQAVHWGVESKDKWFCSELTIAALKAGGCPAAEKLTAYKTSPPRLADTLLAAGCSYCAP